MIKKLISAFIVAAMMLFTGIVAFASDVSPLYWENGREIQYFGYTTYPQSTYTTFSSTVATKVFLSRNWVVSLTNSGGAVYPTYHALFREATSPPVQAGAQCSISGTGNSGEAFTDTWGFNNYPYYVIGSRLDTRESTSRYLSGQFSPDSPY